MPVEVMAKRGFETLTFGPLKPVGLVNPKTGRDDAYAVVQLRCDNKEGTLYNLVGFQTTKRTQLPAGEIKIFHNKMKFK